MKRAGILVLLLLACRQNQAPPKKVVHVTTATLPADARGKMQKIVVSPTLSFLESAKLGSKVAANGAVAEETTTFVRGQPIHLTLNLRESPAGLQTHAVWYGSDGKELFRELREMNGAKTVTFAMTKKLAPGNYRVEGYWGGNLAADKVFEVVAAEKKR